MTTQLLALNLISQSGRLRAATVNEFLRYYGVLNLVTLALYKYYYKSSLITPNLP